MNTNGWKSTVIGILGAIVVTFVITTATLGRHPITAREVQHLQDTVDRLQQTTQELAVEIGKLRATIEGSQQKE
jgi:uncharacterized protein YlxW (UPF0749 family)